MFEHPTLKKVSALVLLAPVFFGAFNGTAPQAQALSTFHLAAVSGNGFWTDPCTWDGFGAGIGLAICGGTGGLGGCGGAIYSFLRALTMDQCFG
jgi:hypothetical protein